MFALLLATCIMLSASPDDLDNLITVSKTSRKFVQNDVTRLTHYPMEEKAILTVASNSAALRESPGKYKIRGNLFCEMSQLEKSECQERNYIFSDSLESIRYILLTEEMFYQKNVFVNQSLWLDETTEQVYFGAWAMFPMKNDVGNFGNPQLIYETLLDAKTASEREAALHLVLEFGFSGKSESNFSLAWHAFGRPGTVLYSNTSIKYTMDTREVALTSRSTFKLPFDDILDSAPIAIGGYLGRANPGDNIVLIGYPNPSELLAEVTQRFAASGNNLVIMLAEDKKHDSLIMTVQDAKIDETGISKEMHGSAPLIAYLRLPMTTENEGTFAQEILTTMIEGAKPTNHPRATPYYYEVPVNLAGTNKTESTNRLSAEPKDALASLAILLIVVAGIMKELKKTRGEKKEKLAAPEANPAPIPFQIMTKAESDAERKRRLEEKRERQKAESSHRTLTPLPSEPPVTMADIKPLRDRLVKYLEDQLLPDEVRETFEFQLKRADEEDRLPRKKKFLEYAVSRIAKEDPAPDSESEPENKENPSQTV